jgi:hypothetical protein
MKKTYRIYTALLFALIQNIAMAGDFLRVGRFDKIYDELAVQSGEHRAEK